MGVVYKNQAEISVGPVLSLFLIRARDQIDTSSGFHRLLDL
jgi:hypothetical protein